MENPHAAFGDGGGVLVCVEPFTGSVTDISVGGCALKTSTAIKVGSRIKLDIDASGGPISCLGQVIRINRSETMGNITNTKFLKVPRKSFNTISAMIFGYNE
ncbi:hypothetical protein FACS1894147_12040 [Spirochaetia bacterium]|nr:hypothetical protein FACS1894147_12040 [Spirochaetia bacterium]